MGLVLTWTNNITAGVAGIAVERKVGAGGTYVEVSRLSSSGSWSYNDWNIQPGVTYYYRVRAYNSNGGYTGYSNEASGMQAAGVAPSGLTVTADWYRLAVTWTNNLASSAGGAGIAVERKEGASGTYVEVSRTAGLPTVYYDTNVTTGVTYYYRVRAYNSAGGYTPYSNEASGTPSVAAAPSGLTVATATMGPVLTWTNNQTAGVAGIAVERKVGASGTYVEVSRLSSSGSWSYNDWNIQPGVTYYYRVRAYNSNGGYTGYSNEASGMQAAGVAPSGLTVTADWYRLAVTWTNNLASSAGGAGIAVERKEGASGTYVEVSRTAGLPTAYYDTNVTTGVTYYYRVRAYNSAGGYTPYSNEASGTPSVAAAPSGLTVATATMGLVLTWTNNITAGVAGIAVERKVGARGTYVEVSRLSSSGSWSYNDWNIQPGVTYYYRVRAYNSNGGYTGY